ncbi:Protein of unknown function, partial [Gryllus bimaculatus]
KSVSLFDEVHEVPSDDAGSREHWRRTHAIATIDQRHVAEECRGHYRVYVNIKVYKNYRRPFVDSHSHSPIKGALIARENLLPIHFGADAGLAGELRRRRRRGRARDRRSVAEVARRCPLAPVAKCQEHANREEVEELYHADQAEAHEEAADAPEVTCKSTMELPRFLSV